MAVQKAIILAGGAGTRLYPVTAVASKQLQPVYNKPMIYYPLSTLMLLGIRHVLIITAKEDAGAFERLLSDGSRLGIRIEYEVQERPGGIAEALLIGKDFQGRDPVALMLGDNLFYGKLDPVRTAFENFDSGSVVFGYPVKDPSRYGVLGFDEQGKVVSIEEKPERPASRYAVTGLYLYDRKAPVLASGLEPSLRGELEITDLNKRYLDMDELEAVLLGRGMAWLDTGTFESLLDAARFIEAVENRQGLMIGCIEEVAIQQGLVRDGPGFEKMMEQVPKGPYRDYIQGVWKERFQKP